MKLKKVVANSRKKAFEVSTLKVRYDFPYSRLNLKPSEKNPIESVFIDSELGNTGFTYRLQSGQENTVLLDQVLEYARDPDFIRQEILFKMTIQAQKKMKQLGVSKREIIRRMGTTSTQFYRLLDQKNNRKTIDQMVRLLSALDCSVGLVFEKIAA